MGRVLIKSLEQVPLAQPSRRAFHEERGTRHHTKMLGDREAGPTVVWVRYEPHHWVEPHSHDEDELIYILEGEVKIRDTRVTAGTAVFIEKDTHYGPLEAGPQGVVFLRATPKGIEWRR